ncbi:MAG TPA: transporter [Chitinophagaceae bacterium]|nr:transporter [Chitinophagaceae bacterium]
MTKGKCTLIVLLACWHNLHAQPGKIDTDRPDQTESAVVLPKNYFQVEIGFNKESTYGKDYDLIHPTLLMKYGLKKIELRLEATYKSSYEQLIPDPKWTTGLEPLHLGFRMALWEEKKLLPKTSLLVHLGIPALGSKVFKPDHLIPSFRFSMQHSIADGIALGYNVGAEWDGFTSTPAWIYTLAPGFDLGEKWYGYFEVFGSVINGGPPQHNFDAGIAYYISNDVKIDISGGVGISKAAPKNYLAIGGSFRFNSKTK